MATITRSRPKTLALLKKTDVASFVEQLTKNHRVIAPVPKGMKSYSFEIVEDPKKVCLEYDTTILPPKKVFHSPLETILYFGRESVKSPELPAQKRILLGVHPCDVTALLRLDKVYVDDLEDPYYTQRRENTLIVAVTCSQVGEYCFCESVGSGPDLKEGFDLLLTDIGDCYLVEAGTDEGHKLVQECNLEPAPRVMLLQKQKVIDRLRKSFKRSLPTADLRELLIENFESKVWDELKEECLACGSCTMVCPTCFCYSTFDKTDFPTLSDGQRMREWNSCMFYEYAAVALGGNFRPERDARIKQRLYHKLFYHEEQFGELGCVGCGRCIISCIKKIDPTDVVARLRRDQTCGK